jgi:hypothetical protein
MNAETVERVEALVGRFQKTWLIQRKKEGLEIA